MIMAKMMVTGLLQESGRVTGVRIGDEEIGGDHVIVADGTLSLLAEMAGIHPPIPYTTSSRGGERGLRPPLRTDRGTFPRTLK